MRPGQVPASRDPASRAGPGILLRGPAHPIKGQIPNGYFATA